jgi:hypothetical protein
VLATGVRLTERENLFRPIHKGIRAMIYELGRRLQGTDFTDAAESNAIAIQLQHDLNSAGSNCILCMLHAHSKHEEADIFDPLRPFDPDVVEHMLSEHLEVVRRILGVTRTCDELLRQTSPERRIEVGDRLNLETNDLFAYYLAHMNNEEATLVPITWEHFSDEQLRAMRSHFHQSVTRRRLEDWMRWTFPALNPQELVLLLRAMKLDGPPDLYDDMARLAGETVDPQRWELVRDHVGP